MEKTFFNISTIDGVVKLSLSNEDILHCQWIDIESDLIEKTTITIKEIKDKRVLLDYDGNTTKVSFHTFEKTFFNHYKILS